MPSEEMRISLEHLGQAVQGVEASARAAEIQEEYKEVVGELEALGAPRFAKYFPEPGTILEWNKKTLTIDDKPWNECSAIVRLNCHRLLVQFVEAITEALHEAMRGAGCLTKSPE